MNNTTYKIGVIGNRDAILPFQIIGFFTYPVVGAEEAVNTLRQLAMDNFGIIYITEDIAEKIPDTIAFYDNQIMPAIILIPNFKGKAKLGRQFLEERVERAVGQNIL